MAVADDQINHLSGAEWTHLRVGSSAPRRPAESGPERRATCPDATLNDTEAEPCGSAAGCGWMDSGSFSAWGETAAETIPVGDELAAIFAPLPRLAEPATAPAATPAAPPRRRRPGAWILALAVVALAAVAATLIFLAPLAHRTSSPAPARGIARPVAHPAPPVARAIVVPPAAAPAPSKPASAAQESGQRDAVAEQPRSPVVAEQPLAPARPPAASPHRACSRRASPAWCLRGEVTAADDRLRAAYGEAARAGVDRQILVDVRSDWTQLRRRANRDPGALIRGYARLTDVLRSEMRDADGR